MSVWLVSRWGETNRDNFEGTCPVKREFLFKNFAIDAFAQSLSYGGGGVVYPYPAAGVQLTSSRVRLGQSFKTVGYGSASCWGDLGAGSVEADVFYIPFIVSVQFIV